MKPLAAVLGLASVANAHTLFTTLFINGKNQGDGTCVRMPHDGATANGPVEPVTSEDMACGRDGDKPVAFTCPAPRAATVTFEFRMYSTGEKPGAIADGHLGPCAVYVKKVEDMSKDKPAGPGWFKIWEDGLDAKTGKWCVDRLMEKNGLLSVDLPAGLPAGYYLLRPEILALHNAPAGDPQFYTGCAQVFVQEGPEEDLEMPSEKQVSIPGYVNPATPGLTFDIYNKPLPPYPMPGPEVYIPTSNAPAAELEQKQGVAPSDCLVTNANWCGKPLGAYGGQEGCWAAVEGCYSQSQTCWDSAPPSGDANCKVWQDYCKQTEAACTAKNFEGPPTFSGRENLAKVPGEIPKPWNKAFKGVDGGAGGETSRLTATTGAAGTSAAVEEKPATPTTTTTTLTAISSRPTSMSSKAAPAPTATWAVSQSPGGRCGAGPGPPEARAGGAKAARLGSVAGPRGRAGG
ncbi:endo-beta-1,4-glucanase D [Tolypocladium capitatum]|uniref:lytic cellulose monooxygenase (C4-dehydrogenating) n=1 Tax=Tolypocladium capitatum TaxID=45235 RepID=A0A2K3Q6K9_9HYPO|nr:endo-beta-1,4-glucanase D [Tolypocladium capitatum]